MHSKTIKETERHTHGNKKHNGNQRESLTNQRKHNKLIGNQHQSKESKKINGNQGIDEPQITSKDI